MNPFNKLHHTWRFRLQQKQHRLAQGQLTVTEAAARLDQEGHIPLADIPLGRGNAQTVYMPLDDNGHLLLVAPPDSAWRDQVALSLGLWPGAVLAVDPDGRLYRHTGYMRSQRGGEIYTLPGYRFNLTRTFHFWNESVAWRLHSHLMPPVPPAEQWQLEQSVALFIAVGWYSQAHKLNPLSVLLNAANDNMLRVLVALETVDEAQHYVREFTNGQSPWQAIQDPQVVHCFHLFARQLQRYQNLYHTFTLEKAKDTIPEQWVRERGSLYLTYATQQWPEVSGLAAALVDGVFTYHCSHGHYEPLLLVLDAALARRLHNFPRLLTEAADYGVTIILTAESLAELDTIAPDRDGAALSSRFAHQLWYPPHDRDTAVHMTRLYGTQLKSHSLGGENVILSDDLQTKPVWTPEELLAWPRERVLLYTRRERPYRCLAQQLLLPPDWPGRAPPLPPRQVSMPRNAYAWLPLVIEELMDADFLTKQTTLPEPVMPERVLTLEIAEKRAAEEAPPIPPQASETKTKKLHEPDSLDVR